MISRAQLIIAALYVFSWEAWAERGARTQSIGQVAWVSAEEGEEDFEQRAQDLQQWLREREAERQMGGHRDSVAERPRISPSSRYFEERGYDAQGFKRLNENTRFRLREAPAPQRLLQDPQEYVNERLLRPPAQGGSHFIRSRRPKLLSPVR